MNVGSTLKLQGSHINFGSTQGDSGYGLKDNSGTVQFKNSGGSWANVSSGTVSVTNLTSDGNLVEMYDYFKYKDHLCIAFEMLGENLYELY